ncbi:putative ATP-dependent RNA helicase pitchoune, partial [Araneus ventricosus]
KNCTRACGHLRMEHQAGIFLIKKKTSATAFSKVGSVKLASLETRQTLLFSATLNQKTQDLVKVALPKKPLYIGVDDDDEEATVEGLTQEYIHRVGRTARGESQSGNALLFLRPEELGFLRYLKHARVPLQEYAFNWNRIAYVQNQDHNTNENHQNIPNTNENAHENTTPIDTNNNARQENNPQIPELSLEEITDLLLITAINNAEPPGLTWKKLGESLGFHDSLPPHYKSRVLDMIADGRVYKLDRLIYPCGAIKESERELIKTPDLPPTTRSNILDYIEQQPTINFYRITHQVLSMNKSLDAKSTSCFRTFYH